MRAFVLSSLVLGLAACETTGDPRQGGLFGWSESKARVRQEALEEQAAQATQAAHTESGKIADASGQRDALRTDVATLGSRLDRLLSENRRLEAELGALLRTKSMRESDLSRLRAELARNERVRAAAQSSPAAPAARPASSLDAMALQNRRLHEEILFLLER